jgi:hypothetical protein
MPRPELPPAGQTGHEIPRLRRKLRYQNAAGANIRCPETKKDPAG